MNTATLIPVSSPSPLYVAFVVNTRHRLSKKELYRRMVLQQQLDDSWFEHDHPEKIEVHWDPLTGAFTQDVVEDKPKPKRELVLVRGRRARRRFHILARLRRGLVDIRKAVALLGLAQPIPHRVQKIEELKLVRKDGRRFLTYEENNRLKAGVLPDLRNIKLSARQRDLVRSIKQRKTRRVVRPVRQLHSV